MKDDNLICKIYFFEPEWKKTKKVIAVVDKNQLFSPLEEFIELKNYGNKSISKNDLEKVIMFEKKCEIAINKNTLEVKDQMKIEG